MGTGKKEIPGNLVKMKSACNSIYLLFEIEFIEFLKIKFTVIKIVHNQSWVKFATIINKIKHSDVKE